MPPATRKAATRAEARAILIDYAALKRRSSTVLLALESFPATSEVVGLLASYNLRHD